VLCIISRVAEDRFVESRTLRKQIPTKVLVGRPQRFVAAS
jgi:hypothetical protein